MQFFIIIRGPLGCGKSTIAKKLATALKAKYYSIDSILDENKLDSELEEGWISQRSFLKANEIIAPEAKRFLSKGKPVIFDGNFYWKSQIEDLLAKLKYPHFVFTLTAPVATCIERDSKRKKPYGKDAVLAVYKKTMEFNYGTKIDASKPLEEIVKEIITIVKPKID